jgi:hypothetical protein
VPVIIMDLPRPPRDWPENQGQEQEAGRESGVPGEGQSGHAMRQARSS